MWFAVVSGLLYGLLAYFGITLMRSGMSVYCLTFWRFVIAFIVVAIVIVLRKDKPSTTMSAALKTMLNGALFYSGCGIFFFLAAKYISSGEAMVIFFVYPLWVMIFNWLLYGVRFQIHYCLSFILIIAGLVFLIDVKEIDFDFLGIGLSLLASFSYAIYILWSKKLVISPLSSTMFVSIGGGLLGLIMSTVEGSFMLPATSHQWISLILFSIVCTAVPILLLLEAIKYLSSDKASLLSVLEPIATVIFGVLLLDETLTINSIFGMALILIGAMLVIIRWPEVSFARISKLIGCKSRGEPCQKHQSFTN